MATILEYPRKQIEELQPKATVAADAMFVAPEVG